jgi:hypothetical protein
MSLHFKKLSASFFVAFALAAACGSGSDNALAAKRSAPTKTKKPARVLFTHQNPAHMQLLQKVIAEVESNNRDYDRNGQPLKSHRGAVGKMQVMPYTAKNPGYGIKPAKDNSLKSFERVGKAYSKALMKKYNDDVLKAAAAYNGGPKRLDRALHEACQNHEPHNWLAYMAEETQGYVQKVHTRLASPKFVFAVAKIPGCLPKQQMAESEFQTVAYNHPVFLF